MQCMGEESARAKWLLHSQISVAVLTQLIKWLARRKFKVTSAIRDMQQEVNDQWSSLACVWDTQVQHSYSLRVKTAPVPVGATQRGSKQSTAGVGGLPDDAASPHTACSKYPVLLVGVKTLWCFSLKQHQTFSVWLTDNHPPLSLSL